MTRILGLLFGGVIALGAQHVRADDITAADQTLAQTLFDEGVKLMDQGHFGEACPKLAESERLDPGGGTLLNLGFCRQNEGKLASAWAAYNEALSRAIKDGRKDREATARVHVEELDGKLAKLAVDVSDDARHTDQIEIRIDGTSVRQAAWGVLSPIDKGEHGIVVTAPGKREFRTSVTVTDDGTVQRVAIPALVNAPVIAPVDRDRAGDHRGFGAQKFAGWVTGGIGVVLIGVGTGTGILAIDDHKQSNAQCGTVLSSYPKDVCTQKGFDLNEQAKTLAWLSDFGIGLGVAAVAGGILLIVTSPKGSARVMPAVSGHGAGASFLATF